MKKNFFKKLSFVLALAMIVSVVAPAAGAFAATAPKLNSTKEYLYLDKDGDSEFNFNLSTKKGEGWKYAWTSSKKTVATVNAKNGVVTAVGAGTTTIALAIKDKDGVKVGTAKASVTVRDNIKTLAITNLPTAAVTVGEDHDFNRSYTTEANRTTGSESVTRWVVNSDKATISDKGVFSATVAGEYTITARAFQSVSKYNTWKDAPEANAALVLATAETKVKAVAQMESATQIDVDTVDVKFTAPTTDVAKNITLYAVVGTTEVKVTTVKEVKMNATNTVASISLYVPFIEGTTYIVKYTDMKNAQFVSATTKFEDVVSMKIKTTEVVISVGTKVEVALLNKDGVDISTTSLLNRVYDWKTSSNRTVMTNDVLYMYNKGDETTVTATFHGQKWDTLGNELGNLTASGNIVAVEEATTSVGAIKVWTLVASGPNFKDVKQKLAVGDAFRLFVQLNTTKAGVADTIDNSTDTTKFKFASSDSSIVYVDANANVWPIKAGTVSVVVKYDDKVVDAITLTVVGERKATSMELSTTFLTLSNSTIVNDFGTIDVKVKDQLGDDMNETGLVAIKLPGSPASELYSAAQSDADTVRFNSKDAVAGTYSYKITANGIDRFVNITVGTPSSTTPAAFDIYISNKDADSKATSTTPQPTITIDLFGYAGTKTTHPSITDGVYSIVVKNPDNVPTTLTSTTFDLTTTTGGGLKLEKIKNGTYVVTAYKDGVAIDTDIFTVKDTQLAPVVTEVKSYTYTAVQAAAGGDVVAQACFKVALDGVDKAGLFKMGEVIGSVTNSSVFVKNITLDELIAPGLTYTHVIAVNQNLEKLN